MAARFKESKHYEVLEQNGHLAPTCSTCHRAMNRRPYYWQVAETTCTACHNAAESGSLPMVSKQADEILHRLNIIKGYLGWTRIYFASQGWPGDSRQLVEDMEAQYHTIRSRGHNFDLAGVADDSVELLTRLKTLFAETSAEESGPEPAR